MWRWGLGSRFYVGIQQTWLRDGRRAVGSGSVDSTSARAEEVFRPDRMTAEVVRASGMLESSRLVLDEGCPRVLVEDDDEPADEEAEEKERDGAVDDEDAEDDDEACENVDQADDLRATANDRDWGSSSG